MILEVTLLLLQSAAAPRAPRPHGGRESVRLGDGVIVQWGATPTLYVAHPSGGVDAVALSTDSVRWHNADATIPLVARGDRVLALAYPSPSRSARLVFLAADSGTIVAELPTLQVPGWGPLSYVGEGNRAWFALEGITQAGHDFLRWRHRRRDVRGATPPNPRPASTPEPEDTSIVEVNLARATLGPSAGFSADQPLATTPDAAGGYHWRPFETGGVTVTLAKVVNQRATKLILRRTRGMEALPDVVIAQRPGNDCSFAASVDRRHVLGVYQIPGQRDPFLYDVTVFGAATGRRVGHIATDTYPATFVVWRNRLVSYFPGRVTLVDLGSGKKRFERPVRDLQWYEVPPAEARP